MKRNTDSVTNHIRFFPSSLISTDMDLESGFAHKFLCNELNALVYGRLSLETSSTFLTKIIKLNHIFIYLKTLFRILSKYNSIK